MMSTSKKLERMCNDFNFRLHKLLDNNDFDTFEHIITNNDEIISNMNQKTKKSFISLLIKFYTMQKNNDKLEKVYNQNFENLMRRDILIYCLYYYKTDNVKVKEQFKYLIKNYIIDSDNIMFLIENNMTDLLQMLDNKYYSLDENITKNSDLTTIRLNKCDINDYSKFQQIKFNEDIVDTVLKNIKQDMNFTKQFVHFTNKCKQIQNPVLIDAGNVLYSTVCHPFNITVNSYNGLIEMYQFLKSKNYTPIIIIHTRHLQKTYKSKPKNKNIISAINEILNYDYVFRTPYHHNDDLYILYLALSMQSPIMTLDNYKDHIFKYKIGDSSNNIVSHYINDLVIKYTNMKGKIICDNINITNYSKCIQIIENHIYIPINDSDSDSGCSSSSDRHHVNYYKYNLIDGSIPPPSFE